LRIKHIRVLVNVDIAATQQTKFPSGEVAERSIIFFVFSWRCVKGYFMHPARCLVQRLSVDRRCAVSRKLLFANLDGYPNEMPSPSMWVIALRQEAVCETGSYTISESPSLALLPEWPHWYRPRLGLFAWPVRLSVNQHVAVTVPVAACASFESALIALFYASASVQPRTAQRTDNSGKESAPWSTKLAGAANET
jgi:hypothetical protein